MLDSLNNMMVKNYYLVYQNNFGAQNGAKLLEINRIITINQE
jgi:hypothetical protein